MSDPYVRLGFIVRILFDAALHGCGLVLGVMLLLSPQSAGLVWAAGCVLVALSCYGWASSVSASVEFARRLS